LANRNQEPARLHPTRSFNALREMVPLTPLHRFQADPSVLTAPTRSWQQAGILALCVNTLLVAITAGIWVTSVGADNPLPWLAVWVFQFPASLLFSPLLNGLGPFVGSEETALVAAGAIVIVMQCFAWALFFKRPRRA
jgi:hypothetical protein